MSGTYFFYMTFKVKEQPEKIFEAVTYQFMIEDSNGTLYLLRKWEDSNGGGYFIYSNNDWTEFEPDEDMMDFLDYDIDF